MAPSSTTKANRVKVAAASVKALESLIAKREAGLVSLRKRLAGAVAHHEWLRQMPADEPDAPPVPEPVSVPTAKDGGK